MTPNLRNHLRIKVNDIRRRRHKQQKDYTSRIITTPPHQDYFLELT